MAGSSSNGSVAAPEPPAGFDRTAQRVHKELVDTQIRLDAAGKAETTAAEAAVATTREADMADRLYLAQRQRLDPDGKRPGSLLVAVIAAIALAVLDIFPALWAAEALGGNLRETRLVALLLVAGLAGFAALLSHFKHGHVPVRNGRRIRNWSLWFALAASIALVLIESGLRFDYLRTGGADTRLTAGIEAGLLALVTAGLLWMSYVVLLRAEPIALFLLRRERNKLLKAADARREEAVRAADDRLNEDRAAAAIGNAQSDRIDDLAQRLADLARETARPSAPPPESGENGSARVVPGPELPPPGPQAALPETQPRSGAAPQS
jgi:hypothetical protein